MNERNCFWPGWPLGGDARFLQLGVAFLDLASMSLKESMSTPDFVVLCFWARNA